MHVFHSQACKKTCFQKTLIQECGCFDHSVPLEVDSDAYLDVNASKSIPDCVDDLYPEMSTTKLTLHVTIHVQMKKFKAVSF